MEDELVGFDATSIVQELQCPICLETLQETMLVQACLHRFCSECIQKCLRASKLECPTCRIHIPSKRSLRRDTHTDAMVNMFCPDAGRDTSSSIRSDIWEWRRLHEQRTASFVGQANAGTCSDETVEGEGNSDPSYGSTTNGHEASMEEADGGINLPSESAKADMDTVSPPPAKRQKSMNGSETFSGGPSDPEICIALRYIPDYDIYNTSQNETNELLEQATYKRLVQLRNMYTLEYPYVRVPGRTRLVDIRAYVAKMLASAGARLDASLLSFGLLNGKDKRVKMLQDDDFMVATCIRDYSALVASNDSRAVDVNNSSTSPVIITYSYRHVK